MSGPAAGQATCDATILDEGRPRQCQKDDGHYPATRHRSVLRDGANVLTWNDDAKDSTPASSSPPRVTVRTTRYTVSALPGDFPEAWRWDLTVTQQRDGRWIIEHDGMYLTVHETWWSDSQVDAARITGSGLARSLAKQHAPHVIACDMTPADAVARSKEQPS